MEQLHPRSRHDRSAPMLISGTIDLTAMAICDRIPELYASRDPLIENECHFHDSEP
jgi:hypothetical protein